MIKHFDRDFSLRWHLRCIASVAAVLLLIFSLAVNLVFKIELK